MHFVSPIQFWKFVKAVQCTRALPAVLEILGEAICIGQASSKFINPLLFYFWIYARFFSLIQFWKFRESSAGQNRRWNLGQQTLSVGTISVYLETMA